MDKLRFSLSCYNCAFKFVCESPRDSCPDWEQLPHQEEIRDGVILAMMGFFDLADCEGELIPESGVKIPVEDWDPW